MKLEDRRKFGKELINSLTYFFDQLNEAHSLSSAMASGINFMMQLTDETDGLKPADVEGGKEALDSIKNSLHKSTIACKKQTDEGMPFLHNQLTISLYSILEGSIKQLIILFFTKKEDLYEIDELRKINVGFIQYHSMDETEKYEYLFSEYEKKIASGTNYGLERFEKLLKPIGLKGKGDISSAINICILELAQIRNSLLHRGGKVDRMFLEKCPWLKKDGFKIGQTIKIDSEKYHFYSKGAEVYIRLLAKRISDV